MVLEVENRLARIIAFNALLTLRDKKKEHETHVLRIRKGENKTISWPLPTVKVELVDFRF